MANNFTFTSHPNTTTPTAFSMVVQNSDPTVNSYVSEVMPTHSLRLTHKHITFSGTIVSSTLAGGGTTNRQVITISGAVWGPGMATQAEINALTNANELCCYISGASSLPNGWYRVHAINRTTPSITISTFTTAYPVQTAGGTIEGDTCLMNLEHIHRPGAYFHGIAGGSDTAITEASEIIIDGANEGRYLGAREVATLLTDKQFI